MQCQEIFTRHRLLIAIEAVYDNNLGVILFDGIADQYREFAWRHFSRINLPYRTMARIDVSGKIHSESTRSLQQCAAAFIEGEKGDFLALACRIGGVLCRDRRFT